MPALQARWPSGMAGYPATSGTAGVVEENAGSFVVRQAGVGDDRVVVTSAIKAIPLGVDVLVVAPAVRFNQGAVAG